MIPEEAVEAAAMAIYEVNGAGESGYELADYRRDARAALEAAIPFIAAQVWDEGAVAGWKQSGEGFNSEYPDARLSLP